MHESQSKAPKNGKPGGAEESSCASCADLATSAVQAQMMPAYTLAQRSDAAPPLTRDTVQKKTDSQADDSERKTEIANPTPVAQKATQLSSSKQNGNGSHQSPLLQRQVDEAEEPDPAPSHEPNEENEVQSQLATDNGGPSPGGAEASSAPTASTANNSSSFSGAVSHGLSGASRPLPALERIQDSFGVHDLSGVRVQVGGPAERSNQRLGARAYTSGNRIAFKQEPDVRLAAHEAAHVVQQRRGVHLKGGVGEAGDPYERQADLAADAVVAGRSAQAVLSAIPGGGAQVGVQKKCEGGGSCSCEDCAQKKEDAPVQASPIQFEADCDAEQQQEGSQEQARSAETAPNLGHCIETQDPVEQPPEGTEEPAQEETPADVEANEGAPAGQRQANAPPPGEGAPEGEQSIAGTGAETADTPQDPCSVREAAGLGGGSNGASSAAAGTPASTAGTPTSAAPAAASTPASTVSAGAGTAEATPTGGPEQTPAPQTGGDTSFLDEAISSAAAAPSPEGQGEAASPVVVAERDQLALATDVGFAALDGTSATASTIVSGDVQFLAPASEQAGPAHRSASALASRVLVEGGEQLNMFIERGRSAALALREDTASKKVTLASEIQRHRADTQVLVGQLRIEAQIQAEGATQRIEARHAELLGVIEARALEAETQIGASYLEQVEQLEQARTDQYTHLDGVYQTGYDNLIGVGTDKGQQADSRAGQHERAYRNADNAPPDIQNLVRNDEKDGFWDGYLSYNRYTARADSALETGKQFREGFEEEARKQADNMLCGKPRDVEMTGLIADQGISFLACARDNALDSLEHQRMSAIGLAEQSRQTALDTIQRSLRATLAQLRAREAGQLAMLNDYGVRQSLAIERDTERAAGALLQGVNDGALKIVQYLGAFRAQVESSEAPPDNSLGRLAAEQSRLTVVLARAQATTDRAFAQTQTNLGAGQTQALGALELLTARGVEELWQFAAGFSQGIADLVAGAVGGYEQTQTTYEERVAGQLENSIQILEGVVTGTVGVFTQINTGIEGRISDSRRQMEQGFQRSLDDDLDNKVCSEAEKAAAEVQPWWKSVLKILLIIVVIVVVAIVLGPAIIGAVGAAATALAGSVGAGAALAGAIGAWVGPIIGGAIVGAIAGAAIQVGSNAIYDRPLTEGLQNAVIAGAIGGALGGLGGQLGQVLVGRFATTALSRVAITYGTDAVFNVAGSIAGDLATGQPISFESIAMGVAIGGAVSIATHGLSGLARARVAGGGAAGEAAEGAVSRLARGRLGAAAEKITGLQQRAMALGERVGARAGSFGPNAPTVSGTRAALTSARERIEAGEAFPSRGGEEPEGFRARTTAAGEPNADPVAPSAREAGEGPLTGADGEPTPRPGTEAEVKTDNLERGINAEQELPGGHSRRVRSDLEVEGCSNCDLLKRRYQQLFDDGHVELPEADFRRIVGEFDEVRSRYISQHGEDILAAPGPRATQAQQETYASYLREVEGIEARLMRHVNPQRLLAVGESTYEYSRVLRQQLDQEGLVGEATDITASGLQSADEAARLIRQRITNPPLNEPPQSGRGYTVEHGVDATQLHTRFGPDSFDRIIFNNPEAEIPNPAAPGQTVDITEDVINGLLRSAPSVLRPGGEVSIGITGSLVAKGRSLLVGYAGRGTVEIGGRRYSVTRVAVEEHPHAARYPSRRTEGGRLRSSMGPKSYFVFRLHPPATAGTP